MEKATIFGKEFSEVLNCISDITKDRAIFNPTVSEPTISADLFIEGCTFLRSVNISDVAFQGSLIFKNCIFSDDVTVANTKICKELNFADCTFKNDLSFGAIELSCLIFSGGTYTSVNFSGELKALNARDCKIEFSPNHIDKLAFHSTEVSAEVIFLKGSYTSVFFERVRFANRFKVDGSELKFKDFHLQSCEFLYRVDILKGDFGYWIRFHKVSFQEQVVISGMITTENIDFIETSAKHQVSIAYNGNFSRLNLTDTRFENSLQCHKHNAEGGSIGTEELDLYLDGVTYGNLVVENISVPHININCINFGTILIRNVKLHSISLIGFYNYNKLVISNPQLIYKNNALIIYESNINLTEFVNIDFRRFAEVVIVKSEVSNLVLSNSILPSNIQSGTKNPMYGYIVDPDEKINDSIYSRETYRQLKVAMQRQGNVKSSLAFKSKEMHFLRKEVDFGWDKFLLYLNYISNNHGISWIRGVLFTITVSILCFILYQLTCQTPIFIFDSGATFDNTFNTFSSSIFEYTRFLTSFPLFKEHLENQNSAVSIVILFSRIFIGYGIYQTVSAFRKFGQ